MNSQDSLYDQLKYLVDIANENGLYDAADYVQKSVADIESKMIKSETIAEYFVKYADETIGEAVIAHQGGGYPTLREAQDAAEIHRPMQEVPYEIYNQDFKLVSKGILSSRHRG